METLLQKKGFICDMDGVIYHGNRLLPGVPEFLEWLKKNQKRYLFLTNSSQYTTKELQQKLGRMGLEVDESNFYTSALATAHFLKSQSPGGSAYVMGEHGLLNVLYDAGITYNDVNPDYVVVGESGGYNLEMITKAVRLVRNGAKLIGTNYDLTGPTESGIAPACRALVAPIELAAGKQAYYIQSLSRSYFAKIIPQEKSGEYFGIYDIFGKGASFAGTMVVGLVTQISGSQNIGVGVLSVMFPLGLVFFTVSARMKTENRFLCEDKQTKDQKV